MKKMKKKFGFNNVSYILMTDFSNMLANILQNSIWLSSCHAVITSCLCQ